MAASNLPVNFAEIAIGAILLHKGVLDVKSAVSSSSSIQAGATGSAAGTGGSLPVSSSSHAIMAYLESQGYSRTAAAGIVGNLQQESSLNPNAPGGGLAQWIGSRWGALVAWVSSQGLDPNSAAGQLAFLVHEIATGYPGLQAQLNAAATPGDAAVIFQNVYERPGIPDTSNRVAYANSAYASN